MKNKYAKDWSDCQISCLCPASSNSRHRYLSETNDRRSVIIQFTMLSNIAHNKIAIPLILNIFIPTGIVCLCLTMGCILLILSKYLRMKMYLHANLLHTTKANTWGLSTIECRTRNCSHTYFGGARNSVNSIILRFFNFSLFTGLNGRWKASFRISWYLKNVPITLSVLVTSLRSLGAAVQPNDTKITL